MNNQDSAATRRSTIITFIKNWTLPLSILSGIAGYFIFVSIPAFDSMHGFVGSAIAIIQPLLIFGMLFLTFLSIGPHDLHLRRWHLWHVLIQLGLFLTTAIMLAYISDMSYRILVECAMLCLLCPTATAAAVVTRKLDGNPADITTYTIIINLAIAVAAPALLPIAHPHEGLNFISTFALIISKVFPLLICPLLLAWAMRRYAHNLTSKLRQYRDLPFYMWAVALSIAIAVTVKALVHSDIQSGFLTIIGIITLLCCLIQFYIGKTIGKIYGETIEAGQALGQKNTVFIIWMGYTFLSPITAVAGGFYSVWHNIFNSYQLYQHRK